MVTHSLDQPALRKIIHVDMDAFYASVEIRERPELRGKPVIVGGSPEGRAVVCSASYEARRFGVRSAMACSRARRLCPDAVFVHPNFERYTEVSARIREIFREVTDWVEPLSLDEAYLDVTQNHRGQRQASKLAEWIRSEIRSRTGLTASAGVAPNKLVAKIASDYRKPDGLTVVAPERVEAFMAPLGVGRLWGVGEKTEARLKELGLCTVADLRARTSGELERLLGGLGPELHRQAWGIDHREVVSHWEPRSRGSERTFSRDIQESGRLLDVVDELAGEVVGEIRRLAKPARTVTLKIRYDDFRTITRSQTLASPTDELAVVAPLVRELLFRNTEVGVRPVRLLGVSLSGFGGEGRGQGEDGEEAGPESIGVQLKLAL
jgi:DNA polymerase-4